MKTVDESMTEEQIKSALRHLFQSEDILRMAIVMSLDEYRAIEAGVRKESAERIAELERETLLAELALINEMNDQLREQNTIVGDACAKHEAELTAVRALEPAWVAVKEKTDEQIA